jgi:hypothetical protein
MYKYCHTCTSVHIYHMWVYKHIYICVCVCVGQYVLSWLAMLVYLGILEEIEVNFFEVGHTHSVSSHMSTLSRATGASQHMMHTNNNIWAYTHAYESMYKFGRIGR